MKLLEKYGETFFTNEEQELNLKQGLPVVRARVQSEKGGNSLNPEDYPKELKVYIDMMLEKFDEIDSKQYPILDR